MYIWFEKNTHLPLAILTDEDMWSDWKKRYTADLWLGLTRTRTWLGLGLDSENGFTHAIIVGWFTSRSFIIALCYQVAWLTINSAETVKFIENISAFLLCDIKVFSTKLSLNNILHLRLSLQQRNQQRTLTWAESNMLRIMHNCCSIYNAALTCFEKVSSSKDVKSLLNSCAS